MKNTSNDAAAPSLDDASLLARTVVAADVTTSMSRNVEGVIAVVYQRMLRQVPCPVAARSKSRDHMFVAFSAVELYTGVASKENSCL